MLQGVGRAGAEQDQPVVFRVISRLFYPCDPRSSSVSGAGGPVSSGSLLAVAGVMGPAAHWLGRPMADTPVPLRPG